MKSAVYSTLLVALLSFWLTACASPTAVKSVPEITPSQSLPAPEDLHNFRYCELIPVFQKGVNFHVEVYNTLGSNDCPDDLWTKLDSEAMKEQFGAVAVKLNGPRYWTMNAIVGGGATAAGKVADFGGIEMTQRAVIETKIWQGTVGDEFYAPNEVQRTTVFVYRKGNTVYELTGPNGDVYRMQSYAQIADPNLSIADLESLGTRLDLPDGWSFQTRVLTEDEELKADGLAYVIGDNLYNSYQRITP